jgi:hypothetical protein
MRYEEKSASAATGEAEKLMARVTVTPPATVATLRGPEPSLEILGRMMTAAFPDASVVMGTDQWNPKGMLRTDESSGYLAPDAWSQKESMRPQIWSTSLEGTLTGGCWRPVRRGAGLALGVTARSAD